MTHIAWDCASNRKETSVFLLSHNRIVYRLWFDKNFKVPLLEVFIG